MYSLAVGPGHGSQSLLQLGHAWPSSSELEVVMTSWEAGGSQDRAHESTLALGMKCQRVSLFSAGETLLPLICSFGGKGCK